MTARRGRRTVGKASHTTRLFTAMQIAGSVLAIPVGLGSAYSIYRANFSVDTTCQTLRANIISMIDKKIDATARRMLVRHDVETFEKTCGGVDPDAEAAFKTLLAADKEPPAPVAQARRGAGKGRGPGQGRADERGAQGGAEGRAARRRAEGGGKEPVHETVKEAEREPAKPAAIAAAAAAEHDPASDARWLDAVRGALVAHAPDKPVPEAAPADVAAIRGTPPHPLAFAAAARCRGARRRAACRAAPCRRRPRSRIRPPSPPRRRPIRIVWCRRPRSPISRARSRPAGSARCPSSARCWRSRAALSPPCRSTS